MDAPATTSHVETFVETFPGLELADLEFAIRSIEGEQPKPAADPASTEPSELADLVFEAARFHASPMEILPEAEDDPAGEIEAGIDLEAELERELPAAGTTIEVVPAAAVEAAVPAEPGIAPDLETVELELTLQQEDLIKLTFEDSLKTALDRLGGTLIFDVKLDNVEDCQRVAAVRLGEGDEKQFALVIMPPPGGGSVRVVPAAESDNPLASIAESYDGLMTALKMAA